MCNEEITYEQVLEYCRKRNLALVDQALLRRYVPVSAAIPKKWIRVYAEQICWGDEQTVINDMVEQWEQENENIQV